MLKPLISLHNIPRLISIAFPAVFMTAISELQSVIAVYLLYMCDKILNKVSVLADFAKCIARNEQI